MKQRLLAAVFCALASSAAVAADQTVHITTTPVLDSDNHFIGVTTPGDGILSGGLDVIDLVGLSPGIYDVRITVSGQNLIFDPVLSSLNGITGIVVNTSKASFAYIGAIGTNPFKLNLFGSTTAGATYSGEVTVMAVPEPATYGMLGAGLALLGLLIRRKAGRSRGET
ncbi:PEP-CTERM sorting domain-containing protein [Duganella callida]|uniref:PEP-CTERM sorting domain-containing protein n=1 Tax=Duganella callida TaxID=2561932 RepID=A0A4Y9S5H8_9BURK|nr:PEP-CTERM sorting domain-containing protein [Duganella callida]